MDPVIIFGAGRTGRGFIPSLLGDAEIVLVDADQALVQRLDAAGSYPVRMLNEDETERQITPLVIAHSDDGIWHQYLRRARYAFVSVVGTNLPAVAAAMAPILAQRTQPLRIITCENINGAASILRDALPAAVRDMCLIAEATVLTTSLSPEADQDPLLIRTQDFLQLPCDADALDDPHCLLPGLQPLPQFDLQLKRKIFTYNGINAVISYLGHVAGHSYLAEATNDPAIRPIAEAAGAAINAALCAEYGFDLAEQQQWSTNAINKFANPLIPDPILRNAADAKRKLGPTDRLLGPAQLCMKHGLDPQAFIHGIVAALQFDGDAPALLSQMSVEAALTEICQLSEADELFSAIVLAVASHA